jgi:hypothetical protein
MHIFSVIFTSWLKRDNIMDCAQMCRTHEQKAENSEKFCTSVITSEYVNWKSESLCDGCQPLNMFCCPTNTVSFNISKSLGTCDIKGQAGTVNKDRL